MPSWIEYARAKLEHRVSLSEVDHLPGGKYPEGRVLSLRHRKREDAEKVCQVCVIQIQERA